MAGEGNLLKFVKPKRIYSTDVQAAAMWGVAAATTGLWLVQPWGWIRRTFFEKQQAEEK